MNIISHGNGGKGDYTLAQKEAFGSLSAFGESKIVQPHAVAIASFAYGPLETTAISGIMGSGTLGTVSGMMKLSTGAAINSSGMVRTRRLLNYQPGLGGLLRLSCRFDTPASGCIQLIGYGDDEDGFFFGYNGLEFGVLKRRASVDEWVTQSNWNIDKCDGTQGIPVVDWQKLNVLQIQFQWLGVGEICFAIEDSDSGTIRPVHRWQYANRYLVPSILNPSLPAHASIRNTTNNTNKSIHVICLAAFIEGVHEHVGHLHGKSNSKAGITTLTNVLTIRVNTTFKGLKNRAQAAVKFASAAVEGNKPGIVRIIRNATLGGSPSYTDLNAHSIVSFDIAGTTVTGGKEVFSMALGKSGNSYREFSNDSLILIPGDILTIAVESTAATDTSASLTWHEDT